MKSADFYDEYADRQMRVGVNARHRSIQRWLREFGLSPGMDVLEIGCGVGTQTELIANMLKRSGRVLAVDLSPRSVELARERLARQPNVEFLSADATELELDRAFDVIVMPDVIEHIPLKRHPKLFANVRKWLKDTGWVLIHMPNPFYLDWCHRNRPDLLQVIDQPIFIDRLIASLEPNDLYIDYLNTYSIWVPQGDYQVVVLKPRHPEPEFQLLPPASSVRERIASAARRLGALATGDRRKRASGRTER
jgi:trans-aconitate 2-methyltransferase